MSLETAVECALTVWMNVIKAMNANIRATLAKIASGQLPFPG